MKTNTLLESSDDTIKQRHKQVKVRRAMQPADLCRFHDLAEGDSGQNFFKSTKDIAKMMLDN